MSLSLIDNVCLEKTKKQFEQYLPSDCRDAAVWAEQHQGQLAYSLVSTCRNEADTITDLLDSLLRQTQPPEQVILCDGGSTDGTVRCIESWKRRGTGWQKG